MKRKFTLLAAAAAVALSYGPARADTVKVGVILSYTGPGAQFGQLVERGMRLYLKEHADKLKGHKVELITRDSKGPTGEGAKVAAQELIVRDKVDILAGLVYSPNAIAIAQLITAGKTPTVIMNAGTAWIPGLSPYFARVSFSMWHSAYPMGKYAVEKLGAKTAIVGYTNFPPGKDSLDAFKLGFESAGGKVIDAIPMGGPAQVPDFAPFFQRVIDAKPDVFYVFVPAGNHATAIVKTYAALGMAQKGVKLIGPGDITQDTKLQDMGEAAVGLQTMHHYNANLDNEENKKFVAAWKRDYGADSTPDFMAVGGWDGMAAIVAVIAAQDGKIDPDKTMELLKGWKSPSPRGTVMIDPVTRDVVHNQYIAVVTRVGDKLEMKQTGEVPMVADPCKALKIGRCK